MYEICKFMIHLRHFWWEPDVKQYNVHENELAYINRSELYENYPQVNLSIQIISNNLNLIIFSDK